MTDEELARELGSVSDAMLSGGICKAWPDWHAVARRARELLVPELEEWKKIAESYRLAAETYRYRTGASDAECAVIEAAERWLDGSENVLLSKDMCGNLSKAVRALRQSREPQQRFYVSTDIGLRDADGREFTVRESYHDGRLSHDRIFCAVERRADAERIAQSLNQTEPQR